MTTAKPKTIEAEVRAIVRRLESPMGTMQQASRAAVMQTLLRNAVTSVRYTGEPDRDALIRLAAHSIVWADSIKRDR